MELNLGFIGLELHHNAHIAPESNYEHYLVGFEALCWLEKAMIGLK